MKRYSRNAYAEIPTFWSGFSSVIDIGGDVDICHCPLCKNTYDRCVVKQGDALNRLREDFEALSWDYVKAVNNFDEAKPD